MSRAISAQLKAHLQGEAQTLAFCARLTRRDGVVQTFSSLDREIEFEGELYHPCDSIVASNVRTSEGGGVDNLDLVGLISSETITDTNLRAGRYDAAEVELFVLNYEDLTQGKLVLVTGTLGQIIFRDGVWTGELRSLMQRLAQNIGELTSPLCRVKQLGDSRCKFVLVSGTHINARTVHSVTSSLVVTFDADSNATGFYSYGTVEMTSGDNDGIVREVKSHALVSGRAQLTLAEPFPFAILAGETGVLTVGCDRRIETCIAKFNNALNYRGEPHLPGTDHILKRGARA